MSNLFIHSSVIICITGGSLCGIFGAMMPDPNGCAMSPDNVGCEMNRPFDQKDEEEAPPTLETFMLEHQEAMEFEEP